MLFLSTFSEPIILHLRVQSRAPTTLSNLCLARVQLSEGSHLDCAIMQVDCQLIRLVPNLYVFRGGVRLYQCRIALAFVKITGFFQVARAP